MTKYLLLKLAEEAGEVVVAAVKHRLHRTPKTQARLEAELGDLEAIVGLLSRSGAISGMAVAKAYSTRYDKENARCKKKRD